MPEPSDAVAVTSRDRDLAVNGVSLAVEEFAVARSSGDGAVIVLVSGGASARDWWDEGLCRRLAEGDTATGPRRVIRYDLRDTGRSTTVPPGEAAYTGSDLVDDLAGLVEATDAAPAHVVGLSLGGGLAQELALRRPELVATLTLMSTSPGGSGADGAGPGGEELPPPEPRIAAAFDSPLPAVDWTDPVAVGDSFIAVEQLMGGTIPVDEERVRAIAAAIVARSISLASADNHWMIENGEGMHDDLSAIDRPTLVLHGSLDPLFPIAHGRAFERLIPGARLVPIPGMGHQFPPPETWDLVVRELLAHSAASAR